MTRIDLKIGIINDPRDPKKVDINDVGNISHQEMTDWINNRVFEEDVRKVLLDKISNYPANTLAHFYKNVHEHIKRAQKDREKKEGK